MKKQLLFIACACLSLGVSAKKHVEKADTAFVFTTVKENPITSIKNQNQSGTCWCFSTLSFFESELLRMGKGEHDLCEMFVVHKTMEDRAAQTVRTHGDVSFAQGGSFYDVIYCMQNYGIVPQEAMPEPGTLYGDTLPNHNEVDLVATAFVDALATSKLKKLSPVWKQAFSGIYDAYLGKCPEKFTYKGKEYTPQSYMQWLGLNMDDYVSLTSYTHHPFYKPFVIEVQDNWRWALSYNLPIDELMEVFDNAIHNGYTIAWGSDVSETGFTRNGIAVMPDVKQAETQLAVAYYATNESRAAFYPGLNLSGAIGWTNDLGTLPVNPGKWIWNAMASLTQPIFQNGKLRAQYKISKAQQEQAKLSFQQTLLDAGTEVNAALTKIQATGEKDGLYTKQIASLETAVKSTQALMMNSSTNYLQVLTAQQTLLTAQMSQISNKFSQIQAAIELYQALGGGYDE